MSRCSRTWCTSQGICSSSRATANGSEGAHAFANPRRSDSGHSHHPGRWFETNGCFLTYYKSKKMEKLLAALNLPQVGEIKVEDDSVFSIELNERVYKLKAANEQEAQKWVETLKVLKDSEKKRAESTKPTSASGGAETAAPTSSTDKQATVDWEKSKGCCRLCRG